MQQAALIRLRPAGPWRYGPGDGGKERVDTMYRSDRLYSAVTIAMKQLGLLDEWLNATARSPEHGSNPAVAFTSLFPFQGDTLFAPPPSNFWPPPASLLTTPSPVFLAKIRWNAARFVPVGLIESILMGQKVLADQWIPDPETGCLLRRDRPSTSPFHVLVKTRAAVDRVSHSRVQVHAAACVDFEAGAGLWAIARYHSEEARDEWDSRVKAALRLLADTGFGGRRSSGWGQTEAPDFQSGGWPGVLMPKLARMASRTASSNGDAAESSLYWLLSLFSPSSKDKVNWQGGDYEIAIRGGRVEGAAGNGVEKKLARMVSEGSVLAADSEPSGIAVDVAPEGFPHPVYRSGFAVVLRLPVVEIAAEQDQVEIPRSDETVEPAPLEQSAGPATVEAAEMAVIPELDPQAEFEVERAEQEESGAQLDTQPIEAEPEDSGDEL